MGPLTLLAVVVTAAVCLSVGWVTGYKKGALMMEQDMLRKLKENYGINFENSAGPVKVE